MPDKTIFKNELGAGVGRSEHGEEVGEGGEGEDEGKNTTRG